MAKVLADKRGMYSWWWDSHISPKNSKWLHENLTDMDVKVKQMIKLIEEDADSFARRAEMYYKKRPELMKLVEEFYRAYRALAERYDHATGVIRQAHRTMAEAFPNQVPQIVFDDIPAGGTGDAEPHFDVDDMQKDGFGVTTDSGQRDGHMDESHAVVGRKGLKHFDDMFGSREGRVRKGLNFHDVEKNVGNGGSHEVKARVQSESERVSKAQLEISTLKSALAKLEAEKEAGLVQYQQSLERLSNMESEVSSAREDSGVLDDRASSAEGEVKMLKEALAKFEAEREASMFQYQQCLDKISNLENVITHAQKDAEELTDHASRAAAEIQSLRQDMSKLEDEKEASLAQYKQHLEKISDLENRLFNAEEDARRSKERADIAEKEVEALKMELAKITEEKEAASRQYQQCLEAISILEQKIACAQEAAKKLHAKVDDGVVKLKDAEERCLLLERTNQTMHSKLETLAHKTTSQSEELTEKHKELGRLWTCIQEERMRFVEAETAFQTLQHLHAQSQEDLRSMATELQNRIQILENLEARNHNLLNEIEQVTAENKGLCEIKVSSALTIENLQNEISSLRDTIRELEAEVELRVDERNALQQEIYCLKEEINDLNKKYQTVVEQVESVGYSPECIASSVKDLQDDNVKLREACEREKSEKATLVEKLEIMEKLIEKNALLENFLSDLNVELEGARQKVKMLEESFAALLGEKFSLESEKLALASQLQILTDSVGKLMEKNTFLENSLLDANAELEELRMKLNNLEGSCLLLGDEKSELAAVKEGLVSELEVTQKSLADLERNWLELKERYYNLERERDSALHELAYLQASLDAEKQEHAKLIELNKSQLASMASKISLLQEDVHCREKKYDQELDKSLNAQIEILILQKSVEDLKERICLLLPEHQKLCESSELSKKLIAKLERENLEQQAKGNSLLDKVKILQVGFYQVSKFLELDANHWCENKVEQDMAQIDCLLKKMQETQRLLFKTQDENQQLTMEQSILVTVLKQMQWEVANLTMANTALNDELRTKCSQFLVLQGENQKYVESNDLLQLKLNDSNNKLELLNLELQNLQEQLMSLQGTNESLQEVYGKVLGERDFLKKLVSDLKGEKRHAEEENSIILTETMSENILSLVLGNIVSDKSVEIKELGESHDKLHCVNDGLNEMVKSLEMKLNELRIIQGEKVELDKMFKNLKCKCDEAEVTISNQEQQIVKLCSDNDNWIKEVIHVSEANDKLKDELCSVNGELTEAKNREESLNCELQKRRSEVKMWESETAAYFSEFQMSAVREALLEGELYELIEACGNLEERNDSDSAQIEKFKEIVDSAESENQKLKAWITENNSAFISLEDSITSLEKQTIYDETLCQVAKQDEKTLQVADAEMGQQNDEQKVAAETSDYFGLQELELRVRQIEKGVMENKRLLMLENSSANSKLEAAVQQIEELKSGTKMHQVGNETRRHIHSKKAKEVEAGYVDDHRLQKQRHEISEEGSDSTMKDIMLDHISECSSYRISRNRSRRETTKSEDQMLEMWETANQDGNIGLTVGKNRKSSDKKHGTHNPLAESLFEKEVSVDKLEISKRFSGSLQEGNGRKVLERLDSDAQKLTNLQITVQDLKRKLVSTEKIKAGKNMEYDSMKEQLEESEEAIMKLFDVNRRLMRSAEDDSSESAYTGDESGRTRRRRVSEQARRVSEKIGRLQLEVQKLQFLLLKIDDENNKSKGKTKLTERSTRILLQDYIYGSGTHQSRKKRRARFCACVKPPTMG